MEHQPPGLLFVAATLLPLASFALLLVWGALRWGLKPYAKDNPGVNSAFQFLGGDVPGRGPAFVALGAIALAFACSLSGFVIFWTETHELHHKEEALHNALHAHGGDKDDHKHDKDDHKHPKDGKADKHDGAEEQSQGAKDDKAPKKDKKSPEKTDKTDAKGKDKEAKKEKAKEKTVAELKKEYNEAKKEYDSNWEGHLDWARINPNPKSVKDTERGTLLTLGFRIDMLSAVMFVMVTFIATLIHLFSIGYMSEELHKTVEDHEVHMAHGHLERRGRFGRFFMFLSLFCFSMLNLVLADNLFQIFVSWELVGICSYLLISFYFERTSASNAANKAFITNRIGDAGFIIGLLIVWTYFGTFNFQEIFTRIRCPERDAHKEILIDDKPAGNTIVRAKSDPTNERGSRMVTLDKEGELALIFPRVREMNESKQKHFDGPSRRMALYDEPLQHRYGYIPYWLLVVAGLGIFLGCVGKSAQFPLQVWLPDAMEGPTPVSALIHAATMVAAGVYLVGRCYPLFTAEVLLTIAYTGAITLFVAATIAVVMTDIKKVLAYSTVSQLGFMMLALGVGGWTAGLLHLLTHAFFKALLFLGSGSVIYGCHHQQDMLKMGGLLPKMRITGLTMLVGCLAIAGTPFFSGWYSKDEILVAAYGFFMAHKQHFLLFLLPLVTASITTFYMFRMWLMTFTGKPKDHHVYEHAHESSWMMTLPLVLLAILSFCVAWGNPPWSPADSWLGGELHHFSQPNSIEKPGAHGPVHVDFLAESAEAGKGHSVVGALAIGVVIIGLLFAMMLYAPPEWTSGIFTVFPIFGVLDPADAKEQFPALHRFLAHKWYFDEIYSAVLVRPAVVVAHWCKNFDTYVIDGFLHLLQKLTMLTTLWSGRFDRNIVDGLVNLMANVFYSVGNWLRTWQTGYLRSYVLFLALAAMALWMLFYALAIGGP
jgi:NADH-quinone oxidoreductase subunit L